MYTKEDYIEGAKDSEDLIKQIKNLSEEYLNSCEKTNLKKDLIKELEIISDLCNSYFLKIEQMQTFRIEKDWDFSKISLEFYFFYQFLNNISNNTILKDFINNPKMLESQEGLSLKDKNLYHMVLLIGEMKLHFFKQINEKISIISTQTMQLIANFTNSINDPEAKTFGFWLRVSRNDNIQQLKEKQSCILMFLAEEALKQNENLSGKESKDRYEELTKDKKSIALYFKNIENENKYLIEILDDNKVFVSMKANKVPLINILTMILYTIELRKMQEISNTFYTPNSMNLFLIKKYTKQNEEEFSKNEVNFNYEKNEFQKIIKLKHLLLKYNLNFDFGYLVLLKNINEYLIALNKENNPSKQLALQQKIQDLYLKISEFILVEEKQKVKITYKELNQKHYFQTKQLKALIKKNKKKTPAIQKEEIDKFFKKTQQEIEKCLKSEFIENLLSKN